jgi:dTDP-4-dehydrorhamnose 3,5-epimerase
MRFTPATLLWLIIVDVERNEDVRGHFARSYCAQEFATAGLPTMFPQSNVSFNSVRGTLRGMHWQADLFPEGKLVRCTRGAVLDVVIDLRPESSTYCLWFGIELTAGNQRALYVPPGFAHGFETLVDASEVFYQMSETHRHGLGRGVRWNDPAFSIDWPIANPILSARDATFPDHVR